LEKKGVDLEIKMTLTPRGNAHTSKGKIRRNLESLRESRIGALDLIHQQKLAERRASLRHRLGEFVFHQRYKQGIVKEGPDTVAFGYKDFIENVTPLAEFLSGIRLEEVAKAYEEGVFNMPSQESFVDYLFENGVPEEIVEGIFVENIFSNQHKGHKLDKGSKRRRPVIIGDGNGFIYESKIPSRPQTGIKGIDLERIKDVYWDLLESDEGIVIGEDGNYLDVWELAMDKVIGMDHPKESEVGGNSYVQRRHPDLSLPRLQGDLVKTYNTTEEAKVAKEKEAKIRQSAIENPRVAFGRDRSHFDSEFYW
tara:strand:- start:42292 stop:43218 length:927 start_codon:yes stop_codon:yes gene_type:complete